MTDHPDENTRPAGSAASQPERQPAPPPPAARAAGRTWLFRLVALFIVPAAFVGLLELLLRLTGFGYPTGFLLPATHEGRQVYVQNNKFGWRFFGSRLSRRPNPLLISQTNSPEVVRVFVLGESAAYGDPRPSFGLSRMLEAVLSGRHPGVRFEVVNAAMMGINSHAVLPIARDCAAAGGDLWVIYMGNNEVVGPFGSGTIVGPQAPPLPLIRAALQLKSTRTGELLDSLRQWILRPPVEASRYAGMELFAGQQVTADDPRMSRVYRNFERNLADILEAGKRGGAGILLSTVAVNLRDCPPLASAHRPGLSGPDRSRWEELYALGVKALDRGVNQEAADRFAEAARIDDRFAELRFRMGQCALARGSLVEAREQFRAARDLDTLRFRCDSRLNDLIRQAAAGREGDRIRLADAEQAFAAQSPDALPGEQLFYEHVHLTFEGNYLLARTLADQLELLLPPAIAARGTESWPTADDCARRLAWTDFTRAEALRQIVSRVSQPPFPGQFDHESRMLRLQASLEKLAPMMGPAGLTAARNACERALAENPDDAMLHSQLSFVKRLGGDLAGAAEHAQRLTELLPSNADGWTQLGFIHLQQRRIEDAATAFGRALELDPHDLPTLLNHANVLAMMGKANEAIREYQRVLDAQPSYSLAWIGLGRVYERAGRKPEAEEYYRKALANNADVTQAAMLAGFCQGRGWREAAATNYENAVRLEPKNFSLRLAAGKNLLDLGRAGPAAEQFREAVRLAPDLPDPHLGLGTALAQEGHLVEALAQFEAVLRRDPANATALKYADALREKIRSGENR